MTEPDPAVPDPTASDPAAPDPAAQGPAASGPAAGSTRTTVAWTIGLAVYGIELVVVGFLSLLFGGLSAMLSDSCFSESTELICESRWQTVLAATPITALFFAVTMTAVVMAWTRATWSLALALIATPLVPLAAFTVMQAVVTA